MEQQMSYILVAYQDFINANLAGYFLVYLGFSNVEIVGSGETAVGIVEKHGKPLFAIVGRQFRYEMTGDELLEWLLAEHPDLKYFRMSSDPTLETADLAAMQKRGLGCWNLRLSSLVEILRKQGFL